MNRDQKKEGRHASYGAIDEQKSEVSAFQKKLNQTSQLAQLNEDIGLT